MDCIANSVETTCPSTDSANAEEATRSMIAYILFPVLLIEFFMSAFANVVLLILIIRSYKSLTTLNIFLFSLAIIGLILSVNQLNLLGLIIFHGDHPVPRVFCHFTYAIQSLGRYGLAFLQVAISYNRYRTSLNPIHWESNLCKAYISVGVIWIVTLVITALLSVVDITGVQGEARYCFWPRFDQHITFRIILHIVLFGIMTAAFVCGIYYHCKTLKLLNENRLALVREMEMTSAIQFHMEGQDSPEKTTKALVVVFGIQMTTLLLPFVYDTLRMLIVALKLLVTGSVSDPSPTIFLLFLTTLGLFTTTSPFFLMLVSSRFKKNVASIFKRKHKVGSAGVPLEKKATSSAVRKDSPCNAATRIDLGIFIGEEPASAKYRARKQKTEEDCEAKPIDNLKVSDRDKAKTSVGCAAVQCGLVLATATHNEAVKEFFREKK